MRSAVIGCGRMGAFTSESVVRYSPACWMPLSHAEAIRLDPRLELTALCDSHPATLERAAQKYGVLKIYEDHRRLLEKEAPVLVGIATRTIGRTQIIHDAVGAGVRALHIEKPLCNSLRELESLRAVFADPEVHLSYGTIRRFFRIYRSARALAHSGRFGPLREIRVNMGDGLLCWTHPHSVDLILYCAMEGSRVESVHARLANVSHGDRRSEIVSDPTVHAASIYFDDGIAGHITRAPGCALVLSCTEGEISVENDGQRLRITARGGDDPYLYDVSADRYEAAATQPGTGSVAPAKQEGTYAPIAHLADCLTGNPLERQANAKLKGQILQGQMLLFAMVQSHLESRAVDETSVDPGLAILARTGEKFA